ncbi:hypothetical protein LHJ74_02395 [Streptomyces sp. N2-109]|uniref:Knr4/Smi1-like domain-containing protein n=1 Tax=Streptomyces gossypii TaxID=2883101 RepID=A0ABT2JM50_9ACTN|nr:hypothetical protein [Streptomyces gossypii]MCT2588798.1 hypothetical protein [Streptomyces gossypii]
MAGEQKIQQAWNRIQQAISRHPDTYPPLRPPAPPAAVRALEEDQDMRIPEALRTLWGIHEGAYDVRDRGMRWDFMDGHAFISLDKAQQIHHMFTLRLNHGLYVKQWGRAWNPAWIPVTSRDDQTMHTSGHFVDPEGRVGSWNDRALTPAKHPTLAHYLNHIADRM